VEKGFSKLIIFEEWVRVEVGDYKQ
jgi:hypothetical protein